MRRIDLIPGAKCYKCKGCYKLKEQDFEGLKECHFFERREKRVWCADETIRDFLRRQRINHLLKDPQLSASIIIPASSDLLRQR